MCESKRLILEDSRVDLPNNNDLVLGEGAKALFSSGSLDLASARRVLEAIVACHEGLITEDDLIPIKGYSILDIRAALTRSLVEIIQSKGKMSTLEFGFVTHTKQTPEGTSHLQVNYSTKSQVDLLQPDNFVLRHDRGEWYRPTYKMIAQLELPLKDDDVLARHFTRFIDEDKRISVGSLIIERRSLDDYRHLWRGMRWSAANILIRDEDRLIQPRDLD